MNALEKQKITPIFSLRKR